MFISQKTYTRSYPICSEDRINGLNRSIIKYWKPDKDITWRKQPDIHCRTWRESRTRFKKYKNRRDRAYSFRRWHFPIKKAEPVKWGYLTDDDKGVIRIHRSFRYKSIISCTHLYGISINRIRTSSGYVLSGEKQKNMNFRSGIVNNPLPSLQYILLWPSSGCVEDMLRIPLSR